MKNHRPCPSCGVERAGQRSLIEDLAFEYRIPLINLIDASGGSVASIRKGGHGVFPGLHGFERSVQLLGIMPVVSVVLGVAAGGPAGRAVLSHFSTMVRRTSQLFAAGPPIVARAMKKELTREKLGGSEIAVNAAGTIDNVADSEAEAIAIALRFLRFMPQNVWEAPLAH
ncbi:hypothetical protein CHELA1G11_21018 [Hyphomicrobiales bacterium]|nr:hypothetical protein CHELA1G11_21018 [Hyphomicrobiales bacterium]CAH1692978.1 hypothetical protein CHELA1G2_21331 [Hyphomicrobiales bacterium]